MLINFKKISAFILRFVFPRNCIGCKSPDFWICEKCLSKIPRSFENPLSWSSSVFEYKNKIIKKGIWLIKFSKKYSVLEDLEKPLRESFVNFLEKHKLTQKEVLLVPIPITKKSMEERRYNQSLLICNILEKKMENIKTENSVLAKSRNHLPQNKIKNRNQRLENVKNSFSLKNPEKIKGKIIILVDDVVTTGATLKEAKFVLIKSGAKKVLGFTIAH